MTKISNVSITIKFKRSIRAISPVIATLLMIAIAVVASLVAYAWVMGYMNFTTDKTGKAIQIQSFAPMGSNLLVYVQNVGQADVAIIPATSVYINSNLIPIQPFSSLNTISMGQTAELVVPIPSGLNPGDQIKIKVTTKDGTFAEATGTLSSDFIPAGALHHFVVTAVGGANIGDQVANTPYSIVVTAKDVNGITVASYSGNPELTTSSWVGTKNLGGFSGGSSTGQVTSTIASQVPTTIVATDGSITGSSNPFTVNSAPAGALHHFVVTAVGGANIGDQVANTPYSIVVTAKDVNGITVASYSGNPELTSSSWVGHNHLGAFSSGTKTGPVTSTVLGSTTIRATDGAITGNSNGFTVTSTPNPGGTWILTVNELWNGRVEVDGVPYNGPISVPKGNTVTLRAIPDQGSSFLGWLGAINSYNTPVNLLMDSDKEVWAIFSFW